MENIYNFMNQPIFNDRRYNFTLTFDRKKYNPKQTWEMSLDYIVNEINERFQVVSYLVVREPHKNDKYAHLHGQLIFNDSIPLKSINWFNLLLRKYGRSNFIQDYIDTDATHRNWTEYCLKDVEQNIQKYEQFGYNIMECKTFQGNIYMEGYNTYMNIPPMGT